MTVYISKRVCCTCLCEDRKLFLLCREPNGINLIYMLLMCDSDAYREGFFKDAASWMVCWECRAIVRKIIQFRSQTCQALKRLKDYADGRINQTELQSLSSLSTYHSSTTIESNVFVDCNLDTNKLKNDNVYNNDCIDEPDVTLHEVDTEIIKNKKTKTMYRVTTMNATQLREAINERRFEMKDVFKCESCLLGFKNESGLSTHVLELHTKKENHSLCVICMAYIADATLDTHTNAHYKSYACTQCNHTVYTLDNILKHLQDTHGKTVGKRKKRTLRSVDPVKYSCSECDMTFESKHAKWKHVQKCHRAGHKCDTCQKVFTMKHNLQRHQLTHTGQHPRSTCPHCDKPVRTALLAAHVRTHAVRTRISCEPCGKEFVCRATYETHLKYASAHSGRDSLKHPCTSCDKKFRSRGELRDHVAYRHEAKPTYKCPVCDKPLATRRCVTRHVKRTHDGIKERARDKMCDYCGLAFLDKQSLAEHVRRHTGARPLTCARCGRAFRQRAALYAHARRMHPRA